MRRIDLTGQHFGRLTVTGYSGTASNGNARWACQCSCGRTVVVDGWRLRRGLTTSCGCYRREASAARAKETPEFVKMIGNPAPFAKTEGVNLSIMTHPSARNKSGHVGVSYDAKNAKWDARMYFKGHLVLNKKCSTREAAIHERLRAERRYLTALEDELSH